MKNENEIINNLMPADQMDQEEKVPQVFVILKSTRNSCMIYNVDLGDIVEKNEVDHETSLQKGVNLVLSDPLYNVCHV